MTTRIKSIINSGLLPYIVLVLLVSVIFASTLLIEWRTGMNFAKLALDPASHIGFNPLIGLVSYIGILFWIATAAICFFSVLALSQWRLDVSKFLFFGGVISLILGLDDLFLLHDYILPVLGVSENIVLLIYVVAVVWFVAAFFKIIIGKYFKLLILALGFFALSLFFDVIYEADIHPFIGEDSAKLIGIIGWNLYFTCIALLHIQHRNSDNHLST